MKAFLLRRCDRQLPQLMELVTDLLTELGVDQKAIAAWIAGELERRGLLDKRNDDSEIEAA